MSRTPARIQCPETKAEGTIHFTWSDQVWQIPFDTQLAGPDGCAIHFWLGDNANVSGLALAARRAADNHRDIVTCSYSSGQPTGYWATQNMS